MIQPAIKTTLVGEYYFSKKSREVDALKKEGKTIIDLSIGSPDLPPPVSAVNALNEAALLPDIHGYQPSRGSLLLRESISKWYADIYSVKLDPESNVLPMLGSKEGVYFLTAAFTNPGDSVLIPDPGYPAYSSAAKLNGTRIIKYNLSFGDNWQPDFDELESLADASVKLMWVNYPHMPTGALPQAETLRKLIDFAKRKNILLCYDNPYSLIMTDKAVSIMQFEGASDVCVELNSLSKVFNMAGWRTGMLIGNKEFVGAVLSVKSNVDSGMFMAVQRASAVALKETPDWYIKLNDTYTQRKLSALKLVQNLGSDAPLDSAGLFLWAKLPSGYDGDGLINKFLYERGVLITPGYIFGKNGESFFRVSLCAPKEKIEKAVELSVGLI
ncbi:MAG: aminotransferase class I/II-fold pyridoxal phosphate-dependent enzyme [Ignavibacteriales bacterium]|nr:aminotransferase class I/II-fold pyridoxal phosphate-dependent enzyme [Ignavibacteriales bacterium]MCF8315939.1 aminotransferase class I/II-fold pyridoxal phosphate-dependent enzyme [Ignavibacteriales bacterium]MCF8437533.1 aminotransferase class I/II-fold pyridoxal phosphate-dependent enzyme [Ignavibacteriales bacterium]